MGFVEAFVATGLIVRRFETIASGPSFYTRMRAVGRKVVRVVRFDYAVSIIVKTKRTLVPNQDTDQR